MPTGSYKFSEEKRQKYLELLASGARRGAAAEAVGIHRWTAWMYTKRHPGFRKEIEFAEMQANQLVEDALFNAALAGNVIACQVWLYNRDPNRWQDRRNLRAELSGGVGFGIVAPPVIQFIVEGEARELPPAIPLEAEETYGPAGDTAAQGAG